MNKCDLPTLSILIPTIGRSLLSKVLHEVVPQLGEGDEVLVIGDGDQPAARSLAEGIDPRVHCFEFGPTRSWGHPQRNWAMARAKGSHLMSLDDDDALLPGALVWIRKTAREFPGRPLLFRMHHGSGMLWQEMAVTCGNVSTQMFVVPNDKARLGRWGDRYEGDLDFIQSTALLYPEREKSIVWRREIIAIHGLGGADPRQ